MKRYFVLLGLIGCTLTATAADKPDRPVIDVQVVDGVINVPEEEAHTNEGHGALVWKVSTPGYVFTTDGIVFDTNGQDKHKCSVVGKGERFRCVKLKHVKGARYKYTVKVMDSKGKALTPLDPFILDD